MKIALKKQVFILALALGCYTIGKAQDVDLFKSQEEQDKKDQLNKTDYTTAIFKTTRLINGQSIENVGAGILDVKISHRFNPVNEGSYTLFGLDAASMRMGVDYGINKWLMVGVGRSTFEKTYDGFAKAKLLRQSTGKIKMPISVSVAGSVIWKTVKNSQLNNYSDRFSYSAQVLVARKFNDYISLQLMPTLVHYNSVDYSYQKNDKYSLGVGGRLRLSKRVNLTTEYYYRFTKDEGYVNSFSAGFDIETGGHVFQFHFTNSTGMTERTFINETTDKWGDGGIRFGFNIARVFTIKKPKEIKAL
ncbi:DUF5777 family beta-barrel protein [Parasediminibacterium sp. JCM 36343]|uniref:DUF5777 family beta-barrel protein n=1 Tax=Parasediminibacterium sp. JCM 36343 TaxID=3374279 RepID=UPI00397E7C88